MERRSDGQRPPDDVEISSTHDLEDTRTERRTLTADARNPNIAGEVELAGLARRKPGRRGGARSIPFPGLLPVAIKKQSGSYRKPECRYANLNRLGKWDECPCLKLPSLAANVGCRWTPTTPTIESRFGIDIAGGPKFLH